jgi:hypothetical protein
MRTKITSEVLTSDNPTFKYNDWISFSIFGIVTFLEVLIISSIFNFIAFRDLDKNDKPFVIFLKIILEIFLIMLMTYGFLKYQTKLAQLYVTNLNNDIISPLILLVITIVVISLFKNKIFSKIHFLLNNSLNKFYYNFPSSIEVSKNNKFYNLVENDNDNDNDNTSNDYLPNYNAIDNTKSNSWSNMMIKWKNTIKKNTIYSPIVSPIKIKNIHSTTYDAEKYYNDYIESENLDNNIKSRKYYYARLDGKIPIYDTPTNNNRTLGDTELLHNKN